MIDVAISSCARIDVLEEAIGTFQRYAICRDGFRLIICEDKVEDEDRQAHGKKWIEDHSELFNTIVFSNKRLTYVYCFTEILSHIRSPYFFRLEDDVSFFEEIDVDNIVEYLSNNPFVSQTIFRRDVHNLKCESAIGKIGRRDIIRSSLYSIATGVFNTDWARKIVGHSGTGQCHESGVLTPSMNSLGAQTVIVGGISKKHALVECGNKKGYTKGKWK